MTDKQIIIDGYDVSGCEYLYTDSKYNDKCCSASIGGNCLCKPSEMICIKYVEYLKEQLKAKEQECNKLYIQLKADEEYHKEEENTLRKIIKNKEERNIELYKENNELKQTLNEIKEIVGKQCVCGVDCIDMKQILQKISEVEDVRN